jgi:hypothetical protein
MVPKKIKKKRPVKRRHQGKDRKTPSRTRKTRVVKKRHRPKKSIVSPPHILDRVIPASEDIGKTKIVEPRKTKQKKSNVSNYVSEILEQVIKDAFEKSILKS